MNNPVGVNSPYRQTKNRKKMKFAKIISDFINWHCPACYGGDVETLAGFIAKYPDNIKPWEYARAARILKYAVRKGIELYIL